MKNKEELKQKLINEIERNRKAIIDIGEYLYKNPELGFKEVKYSNGAVHIIVVFDK